MEKRTKAIISLLLASTSFLLSCVKSDDYETVKGTDIPVSELKKEIPITAEMFYMITQGKYYRVSEYYCRWKGETLVYIQTGEDCYGLKGDLGKLGLYGDDHGDTFIQFEESILHVYNEQYFYDDRYSFSYHEEDKSIMFPIANEYERHLCKILYIDDSYIIAETDVFNPKPSTSEARRAASSADFVMLCFRVEKTNLQRFQHPSNWMERYPEGAETVFTTITCVDFNHVIGTDIPSAELRNGREVSAEEFCRFTEGKYYVQGGYYCQWKGDTLQYLQTGENHYSLRGLHHYIADSGDWYIQFEDSIMHFFNDFPFFDYRFVYTYHDSSRLLTIPNFKYGNCERMSCEVVYIDDKYIIVETAPFQATMSSVMSHLTAARAEFVQLIFMAVDPPERFIGFTDWEVYNCAYPDE